MVCPWWSRCSRWLPAGTVKGSVHEGVGSNNRQSFNGGHRGDCRWLGARRSWRCPSIAVGLSTPSSSASPDAGARPGWPRPSLSIVRTDPFTVHPEVIPHLAFAGVRGLAQQNRGDSGRDAHDGRMLFETHDGGRLRIHAARFDSEPIAIQVADVRLHAVRQFIVDECAGAAFRMSFPG